MRIVTAMSILMLSAIALAQTWHTANQITFAWDPVDKIISTDTIKYQAYVKRAEQGAQLISAGGELNEANATVTFQEEGRYFLCAQSLRYPAGETQPVRSEVSCSDNPAVVQGGQPFGAVYYLPPAAPQGMRLGN